MDTEWQFPYAFSAIDGSHLPIKCPPGGGEAMKQYHNLKNFYSIILLALVDAKYHFIWASVGAPGNTGLIENMGYPIGGPNWGSIWGTYFFIPMCIIPINTLEQHCYVFRVP